jgi:2-polyprenyl-3-methyl-5-hydroxy-6-metoxy-1,4-benzoquinol methylase
LDKYQTTIDTFSRLADQYQSKYLDNAVYRETYADLCELIRLDQTSLLDIGCGPGSVSLFVATQFPRIKVTGFDPAPKMVELACKNLPAGNFFTLDARSISADNENFERESFDIITCGFCIPYLAAADVEELLTQCAELIRENGLFYLSFMESDGQDARMVKNDRGDEVFIYNHDTEVVKSELSKNGFSLIYENRKKLDPDNEQADTDLFLIARK